MDSCTTLQLHITPPQTTTPIIHCTYDTHIPIHHCTNHTAVTNHSLALIVSPHLHLIHTHTHIAAHFHALTAKSCLAPSDISEQFPLSVFPCCYLDCSHDSDLLLPAFLTLPALWYPLCLPPAPTIALPLLMILPCLCFTCFHYWTLPV